MIVDDNISVLQQIFYAYSSDSWGLVLLLLPVIVSCPLVLIPLDRARERMDDASAGRVNNQVLGVTDHPVFVFGVGVPVICALIVVSLFVSIGFSGDGAKGKNVFGQLKEHYDLIVVEEHREDRSSLSGFIFPKGSDAYRSVGDVISHPGEYREVAGFDLASAGFDDTYTLYGLYKGDMFTLFVSKTEGEGQEFIELGAGSTNG